MKDLTWTSSNSWGRTYCLPEQMSEIKAYVVYASRSHSGQAFIFRNRSKTPHHTWQAEWTATIDHNGRLFQRKTHRIPVDTGQFFFHSTRIFFWSRLKFQNFDSDFEISNRVCSRDSCLVFFRSWTYILQISTHVFYCIRCILQVSTIKGQVKKKKMFHFLAPPLFFIFYEQRFLTLGRCSYNIKVSTYVLCFKPVFTIGIILSAPNAILPGRMQNMDSRAELFNAWLS